MPTDGKPTADWRALAARLRPLHEEQMGKETSLSQLEVGDMVVVTTILGRSVTSGSVLSVDVEKGLVMLALTSPGIVQTQGFPSDIYRFFKLDKTESGNLAETKPTANSVSLVPVNPDDSPSTGPFPAKPDSGAPHPAIEAIMQFTNDLRWASTIWFDIQRYGFARAMTRHGLSERDRVSLSAQLIAAKVIVSDEPTEPAPEWVQAVGG
jgi:hypothetical protein